ncbi:MAG: hypothetical protein WCF84_02390 [Anaerolineae bacterium]
MDTTKDPRANMRKRARIMRGGAVEKPGAPFRHMLQGGLKLVIQFKDGDWSLGLWRRDGAPSATEVEVCVDCFGVPADALRSPEKAVRRGTGDASELWKGFVFAWTGPARAEPQPELVREQP